MTSFWNTIWSYATHIVNAVPARDGDLREEQQEELQDSAEPHCSFEEFINHQGDDELDEFELIDCDEDAEVLLKRPTAKSSEEVLSYLRSGTEFVVSSDVEILDLHGRDLSDHDVKHLAGSFMKDGALFTLDLSDNRITNLGVSYVARIIASQPRLTNLWLGYNQIDKYGVARLVAALVRNAQRLQSLNLDRNPIGDEAMPEIAKILQLPFLQQLQLYDCGVGKEGALELAEARSRMKSNADVLWDYSYTSLLFNPTYRCEDWFGKGHDVVVERDRPEILFRIP